jgi:hypothetical protein
MAFPDVTTLIDDFNRGSLGANWSAYGPAGTNIDISGNQLTNTAGGYKGSYYNAATYGPDFDFYVTSTPSDIGSNYFGLIFALNGADATPDGYKMAFASNLIELFRVDAGSDTLIDSQSFTEQANDKFGLSRRGTTIQVYTFRGSTWTLQCEATGESAHASAGHFCVDMFGTAPFLDDMSGGTFAVSGDTYEKAGFGLIGP